MEKGEGIEYTVALATSPVILTQLGGGEKTDPHPLNQPNTHTHTMFLEYGKVSTFQNGNLPSPLSLASDFPSSTAATPPGGTV